MIYFDACYIAKFYLAEPDSPNVIAFARSNANVGCLLVGKAEVMAEEGCTTIHTSDRHMIAAAPAFGLQAVTL